MGEGWSVVTFPFKTWVIVYPILTVLTDYEMDNTRISLTVYIHIQIYHPPKVGVATHHRSLWDIVRVIITRSLVGAKPLSEPMMGYSQLDPDEQDWFSEILFQENAFENVAYKAYYIDAFSLIYWWHRQCLKSEQGLHNFKCNFRLFHFNEIRKFKWIELKGCCRYPYPLS